MEGNRFQIGAFRPVRSLDVAFSSLGLYFRVIQCFPKRFVHICCYICMRIKNLWL